MIRWLTETETLHGPLGKLGTIRALDCWQGRESVLQAKELVATVATQSYGKDEASNPEALFDKLVSSKPMHGEPLEIVPFPTTWTRTRDLEEVEGNLWTSGKLRQAPIRLGSLRHNLEALDDPKRWGQRVADIGRQGQPAFAFKLSIPLYTYVHLLRHGGTFGKNVTSRRWVTGSKMPFEFYGADSDLDESPISDFHATCIREYERRLGAGWKPEHARGCIPQEVLVPFWYWGYARDFLGGFQEQRCNQPKVQEETAIVSTWIRDFCLSMETKA